VYLFWWLQKDSTKAAKFPETTRHWRSPPQLASEVYQSTFPTLLLDDGNKNMKKWEQFDGNLQINIFLLKFGMML